MDEGNPPVSPSVRPCATTFIRALGDRPFTGEMGNVVLELSQPGAPPLSVMLPFTQQEGTGLGAYWEGCWQSVKSWPGASGLSDDQWVLLVSLYRVLDWFSRDKNDATMAAWPGFIRTYLLLGEVGRQFRKTVTVTGTVLLHLLVTWALEHVPDAFVVTRPAFDLPAHVQVGARAGAGAQRRVEGSQM